MNFSPSTSILLNFFFPFRDIRCFLSSLKLQYCPTIVLLNKLKLFRNIFFKSDDGHAICRQEKHSLPKSTARFPAKKRWHSPPPSGCLRAPLPLPQSRAENAFLIFEITIILRNRAEYHLILSRRGRRPSWLNQGIFRKIEQDNCFIIQQIPIDYHFQNEKN